MKTAISFFVIIAFSIFTGTTSIAQTKTIVLGKADTNNLKTVGIYSRVSNNNSLVEIEGNISDGKTGDYLSFAPVTFSENGIIIGGSVCDIDGHFSFSRPKDSIHDNFDLTVSYIGYDKLEIKNIPAPPTGKYYMQLELRKVTPRLWIKLLDETSQVPRPDTSRAATLHVND